MIMRKLIEEIVDGDDDGFEKLILTLAEGKFFAFAKSEDEEGLTLDFLTYVLEDEKTIDYIPLFTDEQEVEEFVTDEEVPEGYELYELEGADFADMIDETQFLMLNPVSGGIVFEGGHLKAVLEEDGDDEGDAENDNEEDEGEEDEE